MEISTARRNRKKENKTIIYLKENSIFAISFQSKRLYNINPLAELNKRIFKSANRFVVNVVYILKDCKCTYFP